MRIYKPYIIKLCIVFLCFWGWILTSSAQKVETSDYFYVLNTRQGLSDNCILQMMQLPDGRLVVRTPKGINLYDGRRFSFIPLPEEKAECIMKYKGQTHLYADSQDRLWIKEYQKIFCILLTEGQLLEHPIDSLLNKGNEDKMRLNRSSSTRNAIQDLFVDSRKNVWVVMGDSLLNTQDGNLIHLKKEWGCLQDLDTDGRQVYAFMDSGNVAVFQNDKLAYTASAYSASEVQRYRSTSLTVQTSSRQFYQIRTGRDEKNKTDASIFLHFNPETRTFSRIFACDYLLHTLNMSSGNQALISSQRGYLMFDFRISSTPREVHDLSLPDGRSLTTGINTVYRDRDGAIWLGTYHDGLIYVSPMLGLFFTTDEHWWQSGWSVTLLVTLVLAGIGYWAYYATNRKKRAVNNCMADTSDNEISDEVNANENVTSEAASMNDAAGAESEFTQKVRSIVEEHLQDSEYGVEQLAHDLCMERTGLYKKLTALTETSPVAFIRSIRLQHAAALLKEGKMTVNEIATLTGFSSPSYFAKCFKKEYGMSPSEY